MDKPIIILFNGFNTSKLFWDYAFEGKPILRKLDFLDNLKKIGKVYTFNQPFFNLNYYSTPNNKKDKILWGKISKNYKPNTSNINFKLEDLDYKNICEKVYNNVIEKYGKNKKYIIIGHSYGVPIALLFSKLYKNDCILCCCIDNVPYVLSFYKKHMDSKSILQKYTDNVELKKSIKIVKTYNEEEIGDLFKLISYRLCEDRIKYYDKKLYVPTIIFKRYVDNDNAHEIERYKYNIKEQNLFKKDKNMKEYMFMKGAEHFIWNRQDYSDTIINTIKNNIKN